MIKIYDEFTNKVYEEVQLVKKDNGLRWVFESGAVRYGSNSFRKHVMRDSGISAYNKRSIYSGDIIVCDNSSDDRYKPYLVEYRDGMFCIKKKMSRGFMPDYTPLCRFGESCHIHVVGNEFQNNDLLLKEKVYI